MSTSESPQGVRWDLSDLIANAGGDDAVEALLDDALERSRAFAARYRGALETIDGAAVLRARMGRAERRTCRGVARTRWAGLLPPPPEHRSALPAASAERARGADPDREVDQRRGRVGAPVRGADVGDRGGTGGDRDARRRALAAGLPR